MADILKPFGPAALKGLVELLADDNETVCLYSAYILSHMGVEAVPVLGRGLEDKRVNVRRHAIIALNTMVYWSESTERNLRGLRQAIEKIALPIGRCLAEDDATGRHAAAALVVYLRGRGMAVLAPALRDKRETVRQQGFATLRRLLERSRGRRFGPVPDVPETVAALGAMLRGNDRGERRQALDALGALGHRAGPAAKALGEMLTHKDAKIRGEVVDILGGLGPAAKPVVGALAKALKDTDPAVRAKAITALGRLGPVASAAAPALKAMTKDRDLMTALSATERLKAVRAGKANDEK